MPSRRLSVDIRYAMYDRCDVSPSLDFGIAGVSYDLNLRVYSTSNWVTLRG